MDLPGFQFQIPSKTNELKSYSLQSYHTQEWLWDMPIPKVKKFNY